MNPNSSASTEGTDQRDESDSEPGTNPLVSYVLATYNRPDDLAEAIDSILDQRYRPIEVIVISNSTDDTDALFTEGGRFEKSVRYYHFPERMGVPRARNVGYAYAEGDIVVTIDDDAVIQDSTATDRILSLFHKHDDVGVVAFQSRDFHTDEINPHETPDPPAFDTTPTTQYRTTNFIGVGNAIRRSVLDDVGAYPEDFVYGFEEMDLSFRIHDADYDILYTPDVAVHHKKSPAARMTDIETQERLVENRIKLAIRNLPWRYVVCTTIIWSVYGFLLTRRLSSLLRIYRRLYEEREMLENRSVITSRTIARIKSRNAMLFCWWYGPHPGRIIGPDGDIKRLFWETRTP
jgi:GT2 family glycosyltransferase